jgi:uncharacterized protein YndB with AHSA1/START domain
MIEYRRERLIHASPEAIWPVVADPIRLPEWFVGVESVRMMNGGDPELRRHAIEGPWGEQRFEIVRALDQVTEGSRIVWRDEYETLDGMAPSDPWHAGSWFEITLEDGQGGTGVTITGRQRPASPEWRGRLLSAARATGERLESSLAQLAGLVERAS